jgi:hypothetical protein
MKRADIKIGHEYAVGCNGSGDYARRSALIAEVLREAEYKGTTYYGRSASGSTYTHPGFVVRVLDDASPWNGEELTIPSRNFFHDADTERQKREDRRVKQETRDAERAEAEQIAEQLGGRATLGHAGMQIVLTVEQARGLAERSGAHRDQAA